MATPFEIPRPVRSAEAAAKQTAERTTVNKTRTGGGFNPKLGINLNFVKATGSTAGPTAAPAADGTSAGRGTPGSGFMSNEDIQQFSEHVRKQARNRAVERAMDAEQLETVLRHIPTADGSMAGARLRSRRVSRHLKRIAKAEQVIAKEASAMYAQFQQEFESELNKVGKARPKPAARFTF